MRKPVTANAFTARAASRSFRPGYAWHGRWKSQRTGSTLTAARGSRLNRSNLPFDACGIVGPSCPRDLLLMQIWFRKWSWPFESWRFRLMEPHLRAGHALLTFDIVQPDIVTLIITLIYWTNMCYIIIFIGYNIRFWFPIIVIKHILSQDVLRIYFYRL